MLPADRANVNRGVPFTEHSVLGYAPQGPVGYFSPCPFSQLINRGTHLESKDKALMPCGLFLTAPLLTID